MSLKAYNYVCYNEDCTFCPKTEDQTFVGREAFIVLKDKKDEDRDEPCDQCGELMNNKGEFGSEGKQFFTTSYNKFNSLSSGEKQKMLKGRMREHHKRSGLAEKKRLMDRGLPT